MSSPRVSVVMLTFNRPQFISRAIESIRAQTFSDWELLVVHDGPNETVKQVMEEWVAREPRVRYFRRLEKGNIGEATNYGLKRAVGEYIAILDDDDYWRTSDKLEKQVKFLDENPDYVCCAGGAVVIDPQGRETMRYLKPETHQEIERAALIANPVVHSTALYRKSAAERVGFYAEDLDGYQDWDFWLKLGRTGKITNFTEHLLNYQVWDGSGSLQDQRKNARSAWTLFIKHRSKYPGTFMAFVVRIGYLSYAYLPYWMRKATYQAVTRFKKAAFYHG